MQVKEEYALQEEIRSNIFFNAERQRELRDTAHGILQETANISSVLNPNNMENGVFAKISETEQAIYETNQIITGVQTKLDSLETEERTKFDKARKI